MRNKLYTVICAVIIFISNQLSADYCETDCCVDPCCPSNWYVAASGSVAWHTDHKFTEFSEGGSIINARDYKIGGGAAGSIGYILDLCNCWNLRVEGEIVWRRNSLKNFTETTVVGGVVEEVLSEPANGYTQDLGLMANLFVDFPLYCNLFGYVGGGMGVSFNRLVLNSINGIPVPTKTVKHNLFAWQGMAGLFYNFCPNIALTAGYRIFATEKVIDVDNFRSNKIPLVQSVDIGLRFRL